MITHGKKHLVSHPTLSKNLILNMAPWHRNVLRKTHQLKVKLLKAKMVTLHQKRSQKEKVTHRRLLLKPLIFLPFTIERLSTTYSTMKSNLSVSMQRKTSQSLVSDRDCPEIMSETWRIRTQCKISFQISKTWTLSLLGNANILPKVWPTLMRRKNILLR